MKKIVFWLWFFLGITACFAYADLPPLIPREVIFGNPSVVSPQISPDGTLIAYLAPSKEGVMNVWMRGLGEKGGTMVTHEIHRPIWKFLWSNDNRHLLYLQDSDGDENFHIFSTDIKTKIVRDLTPFQGIKATGPRLNRDYPNEILVGLNLRDRTVFDMYRVNLLTGAITLDTQNPGDVVEWITDRRFAIRAAIAQNPQTGERIVRVRDSKDKPWRKFITWSFEDSELSAPLSFSRDGKSLYVLTSLGSNTTRLVQLDVRTSREMRTLAFDSKSDLTDDNIMANPYTYQIEAVVFDYLKPAWKFLDPRVEKDFKVLEKVHPGIIEITSRDFQDHKWVVMYMVDDGPVYYYLYNRKTQKSTFLFVHRPELTRYKLVHIKPVIIRTRDGLNLVSYLTLPAGIPGKNLPMVLLVHGGPWARDDWGYNSWVQWLANRGYAVLEVNYRGSTGFGKKFLNAGNGEWPPGKMQEDLTDAVRWAIQEGFADPKRVAIMGGSYGGYATLAGLTFTPELYSCGVDMVGPSDMRTLLKSFPVYWKPFREMFIRRIGDVEHDDKLNQRISPLYHIENIRVPLFVAQGANDPRVKMVQSTEIVEAMRKKNLPVIYVVYPDEGHGFARPQNNMDFFGRTEEFLAKYLGGREEQWEKVPGATGELK